MALDGFTQMFGWRQSTWELRTLTGALVGAGTVWPLYSRLGRALGASDADDVKELAKELAEENGIWQAR